MFVYSVGSACSNVRGHTQVNKVGRELVVKMSKVKCWSWREMPKYSMLLSLMLHILSVSVGRGRRRRHGALQVPMTKMRVPLTVRKVDSYCCDQNATQYIYAVWHPQVKVLQGDVEILTHSILEYKNYNIFDGIFLLYTVVVTRHEYILLFSLCHP